MYSEATPLTRPLVDLVTGIFKEGVAGWRVTRSNT